MPELLLEPCRIWQGPKVNGYGRRQSGVKKYGTHLVHRQVMVMVYGKDVVADKVVMHKCDNPSCFRFSHLELGTQADNIADRVSKNRGNNVLTEEDIKNILQDSKTMTLASLGRKYKVSPQTIHNYLRKERRARAINRKGS